MQLRHNLPSGTVTFLFTDVEGSTSLWEHHVGSMRVALDLHNAIMQSCVEEHGGVIYETAGDSFLVAFTYAPQALAAAVATQRALQGCDDWPAEIGPLRVRMALHTGIAELRSDGSYNAQHTLSRASRVLAAGYGGQVLLSHITYELTRDSVPEGVDLKDMGEHRLKDLIRPEHIYQVVAPDLPCNDAPLKTLDFKPNNLPAQVTPLIGREKELADIAQLLNRETTRLVTLTGPGGTGKTRLSLQVAADLLEKYSSGVYFVDLSTIANPDLVTFSIAHTLGLQDTGEGAPDERLKAHLRDQQLLLVLDNFEQVTQAASSVSELLRACPGLKMLITSRIPLRLRGEHEYEVPPLSVPDLNRLPPWEQLTSYDAVCLFVERAQAAKAGFQVTPGNAPAIAEICLRLDGLPLAVELAAARVKLLPPESMLPRLQSRLKLLTGGAVDLPPRQRTLRAAITWSYDLLVPSEQLVFRRLSIFPGGFTLESAERVCNATNDLELDMLDGIESLLGKSLLRQDAQGPDGPRFSQLQTIREFALEQLSASGELEALTRQHAEYYVSLVESAESKLSGPEQAPWMARLSAELDNIRAAIAWSFENALVEPAARISGSLWRFMWTQGYVSEGRQWLETSLAQRESLPPDVHGRVLHGAGVLAHEQGDCEQSKVFFQEGLALWRELGHKHGIATALNSLGMVAYHEEDYDAAAEHYEGSLAICTELDDKHGISVALNNLGSINHSLGNYDRATALYEQSLDLERELGDQQGIAAALNNLAEVALDNEDYARAARLYNESLAFCRELGDRQGIAVCLEGLAGVVGGQGQIARAARLFGAAAALRQEIGSLLQPAYLPKYEQQIDALRSKLDETQWSSAWTGGQAMTLEQAIAYALEAGPHDLLPAVQNATG